MILNNWTKDKGTEIISSFVFRPLSFKEKVLLLRMIFLKTEEEIELLRESNLLVGMTLGEVAKHIRPGISTLELDKVAEEFIRHTGLFRGFWDMAVSRILCVYRLMKKWCMGSFCQTDFTGGEMWFRWIVVL